MRGKIYEILLKSVAVVIFVLLILPPLVTVAIFLGYKRTVMMEMSSARRQILKQLALQQGVLKNFLMAESCAPMNCDGWNRCVSWKSQNVHPKSLSPSALARQLFRRRCLNCAPKKCIMR